MRPTVLHVAVTLCVAGALVPRPVRAQAARYPAQLAPGARVRITSPSLVPSVETGRLLAVRSDTLVLQADRSTTPMALPFPSVTKVELSHGTHRSTVAGMLLGILAGGATGAAVGAAMPTDGKGINFGHGGDAALMALPGALLGGTIGALLGTAHQSERWESVSPPR